MNKMTISEAKTTHSSIMAQIREARYAGDMSAFNLLLKARENWKKRMMDPVQAVTDENGKALFVYVDPSKYLNEVEALTAFDEACEELEMN